MDGITREETETLDMLYRHHLEFAVGHGVSVHVSLSEPFSEKASVIETEFLPIAEVAQQTPPKPADEGFAPLANLNLDMKELAELPKQTLIPNLRIIENTYREWIVREAAKVGNPAEKLAGHEAAAQRALNPRSEIRAHCSVLIR